MKTCATCRFWFPNANPEEYAEHLREDVEADGYKLSDIFWGCCNDTVESLLGEGITSKPEFGCIFHEEMK